LALVAGAQCGYFVGWDTPDLNVLVRFQMDQGHIVNKTTLLAAPTGKDTYIGGYDIDFRNNLYMAARYDDWGNAKLWSINILTGKYRSSKIHDAIYWIATGRNAGSYASVGADIFNMDGPVYSYILNSSSLDATRKCAIPLYGTSDKTLAYHTAMREIFQLLPGEVGYMLSSWSIFNCSFSTSISIPTGDMKGDVLSIDYDASKNRLITISIANDNKTAGLILSVIDPDKGAKTLKRVNYVTNQDLFVNWSPAIRSYLIEAKNRYVLDALNVDTYVLKNIYTVNAKDPQPPWDVDVVPVGDDGNNHVLSM